MEQEPDLHSQSADSRLPISAGLLPHAHKLVGRGNINQCSVNMQVGISLHVPLSIWGLTASYRPRVCQLEPNDMINLHYLWSSQRSWVLPDLKSLTRPPRTQPPLPPPITTICSSGSFWREGWERRPVLSSEISSQPQRRMGLLLGAVSA